MNKFLPLSLTALTGLMLTACGSPVVGQLPRQAMQPARMQAQNAALRKGGDMQAQYFNVLLGITYTPDGGTHFGFDRMKIEFADSQARHITLNIAWSVFAKPHFMLNLTQAGFGSEPVTERVSMDNLARRAEVVNELHKLMGSDEETALLAKVKAVIAPAR